jgi:TfoX/Sxy family transcriptional regulator of competence genes
LAYDERLAARIRNLVADRPGMVEKKMFGGIAFILDGNMACGVTGDDLMVRIGPDAFAQAILAPGARPFDMTGRPMKGWLVVAGEAVGGEPALRDWVSQGVAYAASLPPKK